jgi:hypothetical protein
MTDIPPLPPQAARKRPAYLIVIYVVLGLVGFFLVTGGIGIWLFLRSETGQKIVSTVGKSVTLMQQAATAPGTQELRAGGCSNAMVLPMGKMAEIVRGLSEDAARDLESSSKLPGDGTVVMCQVNVASASNAPSCAEVARIYAAAVPQAPERFGVTVQSRNKSACDGVYTRDGTLIEALNPRKGSDQPWTVQFPDQGPER